MRFKSLSINYIITFNYYNIYVHCKLLTTENVILILKRTGVNTKLQNVIYDFQNENFLKLVLKIVFK